MLTTWQSKSTLIWHVTEWSDEDIRLRKPEALADYCERSSEQMNTIVSLNTLLPTMASLKDYANKHHIEIVGDMPIHVAKRQC